MPRRKARSALIGLLLLIALLVARQLEQDGGLKLPEGAPAAGRVVPGTADGAETVARAFRERRSGDVVQVVGEVERVLPDDQEGSRHQRFVLRLANDHSLLVAHNIDLAPRVPLERGDRVELRGQYEWNEKGGVLHWTHHDPDGKHPDGWIDRAGRRYE